MRARPWPLHEIFWTARSDLQDRNSQKIDLLIKQSTTSKCLKFGEKCENISRGKSGLSLQQKYNAGWENQARHIRNDDATTT